MRSKSPVSGIIFISLLMVGGFAAAAEDKEKLSFGDLSGPYIFGCAIRPSEVHAGDAVSYDVIGIFTKDAVSDYMNPQPAEEYIGRRGTRLCGQWYQAGKVEPLLFLEAQIDEKSQIYSGRDENIRFFDGQKDRTPLSAELVKDSVNRHFNISLVEICRSPKTGRDQLIFYRGDTGNNPPGMFHVAHSGPSRRWVIDPRYASDSASHAKDELKLVRCPKGGSHNPEWVPASTIVPCACTDVSNLK